MTIGRTFAKRRRDRSMSRLLDHRTRTVLNAIGTAAKEKALVACMRTMAPALAA